MTALAKKPKRISPTQLSLRWFRARGMAACVTEKWIRAAWMGSKGGGFRKDCWGGDGQTLLQTEILNWQAGSASSHASKVQHAIQHPEVKLWLACPSRKFWVMTWGKRVAYKKDGARKKRDEWTPRVTALRLTGDTVTAHPQQII